MKPPYLYLPTIESQRPWFEAMWALGLRFPTSGASLASGWVHWSSTTFTPYVMTSIGLTGLDGVTELGKERLGDRTLVNSISHFVDYLRRLRADAGLS